MVRIDYPQYYCNADYAASERDLLPLFQKDVIVSEEMNSVSIIYNFILMFITSFIN